MQSLVDIVIKTLSLHTMHSRGGQSHALPVGLPPTHGTVMRRGCAGAGGPLDAVSQGLVMAPELAQLDSCTARATADSRALLFREGQLRQCMSAAAYRPVPTARVFSL